MSDFLTNLAARSLNVTPLVRPRLTARFEPIRSANTSTFDDAFGGEVDSVIDTAAPRSPANSNAAPVFESPVRAETIREHFDAQATDRLRPSEPTRHETASESPAPAIRESQSPPPPGRAPAVLREPSTKAPTVPLSPPRNSEVEPRTDSLSVLRPIIRDTDDRRSSRDTRSPSEQPIATLPVRSESLSPVASNTSTVGQVVLTPPLTPAPAQLSNSDRREAAPEPAPIIRVTIGRVDVRAIAPPAPAPPRESAVRANSLLSLDEYLKQRMEGRK